MTTARIPLIDDQAHMYSADPRQCAVQSGEDELLDLVGNCYNCGQRVFKADVKRVLYLEGYVDYCATCADNVVKITTKLDVVRPCPAAFAWGTVQTIHDIGCYTIIEFLNGDGVKRFMGYINGACTNLTYRSLDTALLGTINYSRLGSALGPQATEFMTRMWHHVDD